MRKASTFRSSPKPFPPCPPTAAASKTDAAPTFAPITSDGPHPRNQTAEKNSAHETDVWLLGNRKCPTETLPPSWRTGRPETLPGRRHLSRRGRDLAAGPRGLRPIFGPVFLSKKPKFLRFMKRTIPKPVAWWSRRRAKPPA